MYSNSLLSSSGQTAQLILFAKELIVLYFIVFPFTFTFIAVAVFNPHALPQWAQA
jgi:hypothetical protein